MLILDALSKPKDAISSISIPEKIKGKSRAVRISEKYSDLKNVLSYFCSSASKVISHCWMLMWKCQVPTLTLYLVSLCMVCTIQLCISVHGTVWKPLVSVLVAFITTTNQCWKYMAVNKESTPCCEHCWMWCMELSCHKHAVAHAGLKSGIQFQCCMEWLGYSSLILSSFFWGFFYIW